VPSTLRHYALLIEMQINTLGQGFRLQAQDTAFLIAMLDALVGVVRVAPYSPLETVSTKIVPREFQSPFLNARPGLSFRSVKN